MNPYFKGGKKNLTNKIFQKIRLRLLKENKLTRYLIYGVGEIILVVIGILIAVNINNWNIKKIDQIQEIKYLQNIKLDLQKDELSLKHDLNFRKVEHKETKKQINLRKRYKKNLYLKVNNE
ncbi:MAG: uncharacterized membrane protein YgaE (UPF0421/DUF939 family) [Porticoccaceae bacterium]